jgi:hypothetical protein
MLKDGHMVGNAGCNDEKTQYLILIQGVIGRMSTMPSVFKGLAITVFAGITAVVVGLGVRPSWWLMVLAYIPVPICAVLDAYYLYLEKLYRWLYEKVRAGNRPVDFNLDKPSLAETNNEIRLRQVLGSISVWLFYSVIIVSSGLVIIDMACHA